MTRTAIISVDGHVKASRIGYRNYVESRFHPTFDEWARAQEAAGLPDAGNLNPQFGCEAQWDSDARLAAVEGQGAVAEVLFPNGMPFQTNSFEDFARTPDPELAAEGRHAYNRWLADFCAQTPGRRAGQAVVSFDDTDEAIADVRWAKDHGLGGIMMPPLNPGGTNFFDPVLDPIWSAIEESGLPISQHGGAGLPGYNPPGFAAILTIAVENAFYSARSLWQMIAGGVFDRFPNLQVAFIETQLMMLIPAIGFLDSMLSWNDDWMAFARQMNRERSVQGLASDYVGRNCHFGVSPFDPRQLPLDELVGKDAGQQPLPGFHIGADATMFGLDYPHFESIVPATMERVNGLAAHPSVTDDDMRKILFDNACDLFGFDRAMLQPHVDRVGFEIGALATTG
jgi:predicted TIM-barrel fold metal-dependent hydrolase